MGRAAFTSPGYTKLKEWIARQPDGTTLTVDDLRRVAKENNWTDLPDNLDQRLRPAYASITSQTSPESDFWKTQRARLNFKTAWSAEAIERHKAGSRKAAQLSSQIQKTSYDIPRGNLDEFVKSWITKNLKNYTPGEFDKFRVDLKNAVLIETGEDVAREARFGRTKYKVEHPALAAPKKVTYFEKTTPVEEIKNLLKEGTPPNEITRKLGVKNSTIVRVAQAFNILMPSGKQFSPILNDFPNIRSTAAGGAKPFEIFGITQKSDTARHLPMTFNKIFYKGQLELNPTLKRELIDYVDYVNKDKTGTGGRAVGTAHANALEHNRYYTKGVKEILNGLAPQQKKPVLGSIVGDKKWNTFINKTRGNLSTGYPQRIKYLEELAGYEPGSHSKQIRTLRQAVNKMFGFTEMTKDLRFKEGTRGIKKVAGWLPSYDHLVNISFAAQSKNPVIARIALDNISIVPANDNLFVKGFGFDGDKLFNSKVYEYENALPGEKLSKLNDLKTFSKDMGIKIKVEGGKVIPSPIEDLFKKPLPAKMESYVSDLVKKNPNIASHPDFQLLPKDFREMITKYKGGDPAFLGKFKPQLVELNQYLVDLVSGLKPGTLAHKRVCGVATKVMKGLAAGGRVGYKAAGVVGSCPIIPALESAPEQTMNELSKLRGETGILGKIRNTARGFLGAFGKFGPAAGKYGAIAAAGALAQPLLKPLVKQFMNDDPSTYLTDPEQQAGMLEALLEAERAERPKPRSEILDWTHTGATVGATAAAVPGTGAVYKYRRGLSELKIPKAGPISKEGLTAGDYIRRHGKGFGPVRAGAGAGMKLLSGMFTPAGLLATEPLRIAQMRKEGESWGEVAKSPTLWMGPAFARGMTGIATAGMKKGSMLAKALRLGMSPGALRLLSRAGGYGLAASLGLSGYDKYKDWKNKRGWFAKD